VAHLEESVNVRSTRLRSSDASLISVVIPVFNEEKNVWPAYEAVVRVFEKMEAAYRFEIIFTDNHSTDNTYAELRALAARDERVRVVRFIRNYGFQRSILTAYRHANGDAAIQIDCDLQDSPELFERFLELWEQGHDVVVGLRRRRKEARALTWMRRGFYMLLNKISDDQLTPDAGDFRLIDKSILERLRNCNHQNPYVRGLISSFAIRQAGVPYDRDIRKFEQSKFPVRRLIGFALNGVVAHSILPLRLASYIGATVSLITLLLSGFYIISALVFGADWPRGFATTTVLILFGISLNGIFMGILGEYVGRIYNQVHSAPLTVIESSINVPGGGDSR
jgi:polyisoprenyl-phosphate glycosyltransferase